MPDLTIAHFHQLRAGNWRFPIAGNSHLLMVVINSRYYGTISISLFGIENAILRACRGEKSAVVRSRGSADFLIV